ncbi:chaplin [Streptomyces sp. NPDC056390]|uniref:chaplin n=1 Tax=Streptomyces sp. NPDC056390 TaxID=3345806 RepID=UPI0035D5F0BF
MLTVFSAGAVFGGTTEAIANPPPPVPDPATNSQTSPPPTTNSQTATPRTTSSQTSTAPATHYGPSISPGIVHSKRNGRWTPNNPNNVQVPINIPINICGNSLNTAALQNPAFENTCSNREGYHDRSGYSSHRDAGSSYSYPGRDDSYSYPGRDDSYSYPGTDDSYSHPGTDDSYSPPDD